MENPEKSIVGTFKASLEVFKAWIAGQAGKFFEVDTTNRLDEHSGWIKQADNFAALQHLGRDSYTIHNQSQLSQPLKEGQWADIKYHGGVGVVSIIDKELGKGKSGVAD
jgi:hypothetical protein